jgi:hypothetical protein
MKKKFLFITIIIFFCLFLLIEITTKNFIKKNFQNKHSLKSIEIYKKYYVNVNHLRSPFQFNYDELVFTKINNNGIKSSILFQGDSWSEQFTTYEESKKMVTDFAINNDINFFLAGTSSYSPSIYQAQLSMLKKNFNIDPNIIVVGIDQTDIGDELCRYKNKRSYVNNELIVEPYKNASEGYLYNLDETFKRIEILNSNKLSIIKLLLLSTIKAKEYFNNYKYGKICSMNEIVNPLLGKITENEKEYFSNVFLQYVENVFLLKNISYLIIVTHPHRDHVLKRYKVDVKDIIDDVVFKNPNRDKIKIINFNNDLDIFLKNNNLEKVFTFDDPHHVTEYYHKNIYTQKILNEISNFLK